MICFPFDAKPCFTFSPLPKIIIDVPASKTPKQVLVSQLKKDFFKDIMTPCLRCWRKGCFSPLENCCSRVTLKLEVCRVVQYFPAARVATLANTVLGACCGAFVAYTDPAWTLVQQLSSFGVVSRSGVTCRLPLDSTHRVLYNPSCVWNWIFQLGFELVSCSAPRQIVVLFWKS